jgi:2-dehydro-3-deoxygluconokinase
VSAVPDSSVGDACLSFLQQFGLDTSLVVRRPGRLGLFYYEPGGVGRAAQVIYDRAGSAFAECDPAAYDWTAILTGASWLHLTGTAPALGPRSLQAVQDALAAASTLGVGVSLDLNYRKALWDKAEAGRVLRPLLDQVDVLLGSGEDAAQLLGAPPSWDPDDPSIDDHLALAAWLRETYGLRNVAGTVRTTGPDGVALVGLLVDADGAVVSQGHEIVDATGRIGTGDAFAAGLLRGLLLAETPQRVVDFATAAAHLKQSIQGDVNLVSIAEVEAVIVGEATDRIRR